MTNRESAGWRGYGVCSRVDSRRRHRLRVSERVNYPHDRRDQTNAQGLEHRLDGPLPDLLVLLAPAFLYRTGCPRLADKAEDRAWSSAREWTTGQAGMVPMDMASVPILMV